jgi:hypothetical protein
MPPTPTQAWFNLPLAETGFRPGSAVAQDTKNGAAMPATAAVRRNWRRDKFAGAEKGASLLPRRDEAFLSFMPEV